MPEGSQTLALPVCMQSMFDPFVVCTVSAKVPSSLVGRRRNETVQELLAEKKKKNAIERTRKRSEMILSKGRMIEHMTVVVRGDQHICPENIKKGRKCRLNN